jgi:hypothetical protein
VSVSLWRLLSCLLALCTLACSGRLEAPRASAGRLVARQGEARAERMLEPLRRKAAAAGAGPMTVIGVAIARANDQLGGFVERLDPRCVLALARPGRGLQKVELYVFAEDGRMLGVAQSRDGQAALMVCEPQVKRLYVAARIVRGRGLLALAVQAVVASKADAVARAVKAAGYVAGAGSALERRAQGQRRAAARRAALGIPFRLRKQTSLPLHGDAESVLSLRLGAGRCLHAAAVQQAGLGVIRMRLLAESGRVVARGQETEGASWLLLCSAQGGEFSLQLRGAVGRSRVWVELAESNVGAATELANRSWFDAAGGLFDLKTAMKRYRRRLASSPLEGVGKTLKIALKPGRLHVHELKLPAGCRRIDTVASAPLGSLKAELWTTSGRRLDRVVGFEQSSLFDCGVATTRRLELRTLDAGATVAVVVRVEPKPAAPLLKYPAATRRLWRKLEEVSGRLSPFRLRSSRSFAVPPQAERTVDIHVPVKSCVRLAVASEGAPLQLRPEGSASLWSPPAVVQVRRICGGQQPSQQRIHLRNTGDKPVAGLWLLQSEEPLRRR